MLTWALSPLFTRSYRAKKTVVNSVSGSGKMALDTANLTWGRTEDGGRGIGIYGRRV
jgi:hypothetical protein